MNKKLKRLAMIVMVLTCILASNVNVFAAQIGEKMIEPEEGWKRYNENDENLQYVGNGWYDGTHPVGIGGYIKVTGVNENELRFNFTGDKIRIITPSEHNLKAKIIIDGIIEESFPERANEVMQLELTYEKSGLASEEHSVRIINGEGAYLSADAIDLDLNGVLLPYDESVNKEMPSNEVIVDAEPEKEKIRVGEDVVVDLTMDNITAIAAEDIRIKYDEEKLKFLGFEETDGIKLIKDIQKLENGELRVILASKGEANIVNEKKSLLQLNFKGLQKGEAKIDITAARVSDGIEMEKDLEDVNCDEGIVIIEAVEDVNRSGEFTLLDLAIDARHLGKDPESQELQNYNTDIVINDAIDEDDLVEIGKLMIANPNYNQN